MTPPKGRVFYVRIKLPSKIKKNYFVRGNNYKFAFVYLNKELILTASDEKNPDGRLTKSVPAYKK